MRWLAVVALLVLGCVELDLSGTRCNDDGSCGRGLVCVANRCVVADGGAMAGGGGGVAGGSAGGQVFDGGSAGGAANPDFDFVVLPSDPQRCLAGGIIALNAVARPTDGGSEETVTTLARWTSTAPAIARVDGTGTVTCLDAGMAAVEASHRGATSKVQVTVIDDVAIVLEVTPPTLSLFSGVRDTLLARFRLDSGTTLEATSASWASADPQIVSVDSAGQVVARRAGATRVTATANGLSGGALVNVESLPVTALSIRPGNPVIAASFPATLRAEGTLVDGGIADLTEQVVWDSSNTAAVAFEGAAGVAFFRGIGATTLTATYEGTGTIASLPIPRRRVAFVTEATGTASLSTWAGMNGLSGADALCQREANGASLPGTYRAWLSTAGQDAWCSVAGGSGTRPTCTAMSGGPWVRADGFPFARPLGATGDLTLLSPAVVSASAQTITNDALPIFTGTASSGRVVGPNPCDDWSSASAGSTRGAASWAMGADWSLFLSPSCGDVGRLLCFEAGSDGGTAPLPTDFTLRAPPRLIFVSSRSTPGNVGEVVDGGVGLAAADELCTTLGRTVPGKQAARFQAWLSTSSAPAVTRFSLTSGPWARPDGIVVADTLATLRTSPLFSALALDESSHATFEQAWTGTTDGGTCGDWTTSSLSARGALGQVSSTRAGEWENARESMDCGSLHPLVCLETN